MLRIFKRILLAVVVLSGALFALARWNPVPKGNNALRLTPERTLQNPDRLWASGFSPDGTLVATAGANGNATIWRVADGAKLRDMHHDGGLTWLVWSPDGQYVYTSSYDKLVRKWRVSDGALLLTFTGHTDVVWSLAASSDGKYVASGSNDKNIILWDAKTGTKLRTLTGHTLNVWSLAFSPDSKRLVSGSFDHSVRVWNVEGSNGPWTLGEHGQAVVGVGWSKDGQLIASSGDDSRVRLWRVSDGSLLRTLDNDPHHTYRVAFSPDGKYLATGSRDHGSAGEIVQNFLGQDSAGLGDTIRIYQVSDGGLVTAIAHHRDDVFGLDFSPDGKHLVSSSVDKTAVIWRLE
jgi:WD40 repeat protein